MGDGFLSGLGTLLGGFNAARRINEEGFDFREADAFKEFQRQRQQELARQADEDRAAQIGADILLGSEPGAEPDLGTLLPETVNRQRTMARARGLLAQTKPALETQRAYRDIALENLKQTGRRELEELRWDERQALANLNAALEQNQQPSERDRFIAEQAAKRTGMSVQAMMQRFNLQQQSRVIPVDVTEGSQTVRRFLTPGQALAQGGMGTEGFARKGTTQLNRAAAADSSLQLGSQLLQELQTPDLANAIGPIMGRYKNLEAAAGAGDPTARYLHGAIKSLAALQPQIHGYRAVQFARDIEQNLLQTSQSPRALAAAIQGLLQASRAVGDVDLYQFMPGDFQSYAGAGGFQPGAAQQEFNQLLELGLTPDQIVQMFQGGQ